VKEEVFREEKIPRRDREDGQRRGWLGLGLRRTSAEGVVPVVEGRQEKADGRMEGEEGVSHGLTDGIAIKAAEDVRALVEKVRQPSGIGPCTGGGDATVIGMKDVATEGVDGRFAEDNVRTWERGNGEEAKVFAGTRSHAAPGHGACATQFCADGLAEGVAQEEDGVGFCVGVEITEVGERVDERERQSAMSDQIADQGREVMGSRWRQAQRRR
jgi:hypothetical protein